MPAGRALTRLGRPATWRLQHFETAREQMVDRVIGGRRGEPETALELVEDGRRPRSQVEVPAEHERPPAGERERALRPVTDVLLRLCAAARGCVQVPDTQLRAAGL